MVIYRIFWFFGFNRNANSLKNEQKIAKFAAKELIELSKKGDVVLIGHGVKNYLIAKELKNLNSTEYHSHKSLKMGKIF